MELFNLYFGKEFPRNGFNSVKVGPFQINVKAEYSSLVDHLPMPDIITIPFDGEWKASPGKKGNWIATADCCVGCDAEPSILALHPINDNGVWDLCQILTFLNGRNVSSVSSDVRKTPDTFGSRACIDMEILRAAAVMWASRQSFIDRKLVYSLLLYNQAFSCKDINLQAGIINPAFNGVYDDWLRTTKRGKNAGDEISKSHFSNLEDLTKEEKDQTKIAVSKLVDSFCDIEKNKRESLKALLRSKIEGGLLGPVNLIYAMLVSESIIPKDSGEEILNRIKFINAVRNKFVHSGHPPEFAKNPLLSVEFSIFIIGRLIPDIIQMYLGKVAGFTESSVGSLSQFKHDISEYFLRGIYGGFKVEEESYSDKVNAILSGD